MKDSLHFILLGVLGLLGVVMMAIGVVSKTGAEEKLNTAATQVEGALKSGPPTAGDVKSLEARQASFNAEVSNFESAYDKDHGAKLFRMSKTFASSDDFVSSVASREIKDLKPRFAALRRVPEVPGSLAGATYGREEDESAAFWDALSNEMTRTGLQVADIDKAQAKLRIMKDVVMACERLLASPQYKGSLFVFRKFDFGNFNNEVAPDSKDPWLKHEFAFSFDADPSLALAILDALLAPSEATTGTGDNKREALPYMLVQLSGAQPERVHVAQFKVNYADRKEWGIPDDWKEENEPANIDEGKRADLAAALEKKIVLPQPLRYEMKLYGLRGNPAWKAVAKPAETPAEGG